jgi:hypothetical protein
MENLRTPHPQRSWGVDARAQKVVTDSLNGASRQSLVVINRSCGN